MTGYHRKVIRITAEDSPNVQWARAQIAAGYEPDGTQVLDGVMPWDEYQKRLKTWDPIRISVGLKAEFYKGAQVFLYPVEWRERAERKWAELHYQNRAATGIGVDPGEGQANTSFAAADKQGVIELRSLKTPDTNNIPLVLEGFVTRHRCEWRNVVIDAGGGGKQLADRLRAEGKPVRTVGFGEGISTDLHRGIIMFQEKQEVRTGRIAYVTRRAQMYGVLSELMDPFNPHGFGLPPATFSEACERLHRALAIIPRIYDHEEKLVLPPKNLKPGQKPGTGMRPLSQLIGFSPDEADAVVLAVEAVFGTIRPTVGAV